MKKRIKIVAALVIGLFASGAALAGLSADSADVTGKSASCCSIFE